MGAQIELLINENAAMERRLEHLEQASRSKTITLSTTPTLIRSPVRDRPVSSKTYSISCLHNIVGITSFTAQHFRHLLEVLSLLCRYIYNEPLAIIPALWQDDLGHLR